MRVEVEGTRLFKLIETDFLSRGLVDFLSGTACHESSAMSVPLNYVDDLWAVHLFQRPGHQRTVCRGHVEPNAYPSNCARSSLDSNEF